MSRLSLVTLATLCVAPLILQASEARTRYALILDGEPVAPALKQRPASRSAVEAAESRVFAAQRTLSARLSEERIRVTGSANTVLNAIFVVADPAELAKLEAMPGVARVVEMQPLKRLMVRAGELVNATAAWRNVGGEASAGAGVKIAVLDSGIDQQHAAFTDPSLTAPAGYPRCRQADCPYTNSKVIVARSYVEMLVLGDVPEDSRPDDLTPRDRVGHGTAVAMAAAGTRHNSPLGSMAGIAPKAFVGNYKIFGSPGVNDVTFDDVVIRALDDAVRDGMDIAVLSFGRSAIWSPADRGSVCQLNGNAPCDPWAAAVEQAVTAGMTVVVAAGNDGDNGVYAPAYNTINTPATVPAALSVGASTSVQRYFSTLRVPGLRDLTVQFGDGPRPSTPLSAPVRDVSAMQGEDATGCGGISNGALTGTIAILRQGNCTFATKVNHAQKAGAVGVVIERPQGSEGLFPMTKLKETGIPAVVIGATNGKGLRDWAAANAGNAATLDAALSPAPFDQDIVAFFSSYGPSLNGGIIKPEVVAPGQSIYMATQRLDPNGDMYSPDGYTAAQGTSFSAPIAAGAAALFKQRFPDATPAQVKSAVVNTASNTVDDYDNNDRLVRASVRAVGSGKVNADGVSRTNISAEPSTLSFGYITTRTPANPGIAVRVNNHSASALSLTVEVRARINDPAARIEPDATAFTLQARTSRQLTVVLRGNRSAAGAYEGEVVISGGAVPLRIPYLYLVGDGVIDNLVPLRNFDFVSEVNASARFLFKALDKYGVPVANARVAVRPTLGGGSVERVFDTDSLGIAEAQARLGPTFGEQEFEAEAGGLKTYFGGRARLRPAIGTGGVVNTASGQAGRGVAPGSFATIFGRNLSDSTSTTRTPWLPEAVAGVSVSFDAPERRISAPGRLYFVSDSQVNVQVPWELQGLNTAKMKVSIGASSSAIYDVPLNDFAPAMFEYTDPAAGRQLAAALDQRFQLISSANPVARGEAAQVYVNGMGPVDNRPGSGEPASSATLAPCRVLPEVSIGGRSAELLFCGLAPGFAGLYQINVRIPADAPTGVQPIVVTSNGVASKIANLPLR